MLRRSFFWLFLYMALAIHFFISAMLWSNRRPSTDSFYCNVRVPESLLVQVTEPPSKKKGAELQKQKKEKGDGDSDEPSSVIRQNAQKMRKGNFQSLLGDEKDEWGDLLNELEKTRGIRSKYKETFDNLIKNSDVSESYIRRKRRYEDIIVKEVFPSLRDIEKPFEEIIRQAPVELEKYNRRNEIIEDYRSWSRGENLKNKMRVRLKAKSRKQGRPPLVFPKEKREKYFDSILKESKEEQLYDLLSRYMDHDPSKGDLPITVRELYYKNLQRLAYTFSSDPTYLILDYFDENLNKEDFLKNSLYQLSRLKGTKTGTELLFILENIYDIQQRALRFLFRFRDEYPSFSPEKKKQLRVETIRRVVEKYMPILKSKKLDNYDAVYNAYLKRRLEVMDYLLKTSPNCYRCQDALFEKANILWMKGFEKRDLKAMSEAVSIWKSISTNENPGEDFLSRSTLVEMLPILKSYTPGNRLTEMQITQILRTRLTRYLEEKRKREKRLLYP